MKRGAAEFGIQAVLHRQIVVRALTYLFFLSVPRYGPYLHGNGRTSLGRRLVDGREYFFQVLFFRRAFPLAYFAIEIPEIDPLGPCLGPFSFDVFADLVFDLVNHTRWLVLWGSEEEILFHVKRWFVW